MASSETSSSTSVRSQKLNYTVWIIGDSYVRRGAQRAQETVGNNLGLPGAHISWFGWGGLRWKRLPKYFQDLIKGRVVPDVLVLHCGGNDIGEVTSVLLVNSMKEDLLQMKLQHPDMKILFSSLTQRCWWKAGAKPAKLDKARKFVNSVMATFVDSLNGAMIMHPHIRHDSPGLFLKDGVHFTPMGNYIFLSSIANCLKDHIQMQ
nr:uncharacterized protein LOC103910855 [Danio rerio]|eukprot:XP_009299120.1 uncharacterized protein LOC103910855 [Danio rerio]